MTAPISNGPTTTRLHHYAGHYFDDSQMSLVCRVLEATEDGTYTHFRCEITQRLVDPSLIDEQGRFRYEDLHTVEYVGDARRRIYRYFSDRVERFGTFVRSFKESLLP